MACGKAVVLTDACGAPVTDGKDGMVVGAGDTEALAVTLLLLAAKRDLVADLGNAAAKTAQRYGWGSFRARMAELLQGALAEPRLRY
jgi:glycosyltransferase involved in cell wall biosynthesis